MRLSAYPFVVVRIACTKCSRRGQYRLARLTDRHAAEMTTLQLLGHLAGDCRLRDPGRPGIDKCGAYYPDLGGTPRRPPDVPYAMRPQLKK